MTEAQLIAIEGNIGVGKTTLAKALAPVLRQQRQVSVDVVLEEDIHNPWLQRFYKDRQRFALQTQLHFLLGRAEQWRRSLTADWTIVDHTPTKDAVFAALTLSPEELALYRGVLHYAANDLTALPDVTVYLRADVQSCLERIRLRGKPQEDRIDADYLRQVEDGYGRWLDGAGRERDERIVVVDTNAHNVVAEDGALERLLEAITAAAPGITYCNPFV